MMKQEPVKCCHVRLEGRVWAFKKIDFLPKTNASIQILDFADKTIIVGMYLYPRIRTQQLAVSFFFFSLFYLNSMISRSLLSHDWSRFKYDLATWEVKIVSHKFFLFIIFVFEILFERNMRWRSMQSQVLLPVEENARRMRPNWVSWAIRPIKIKNLYWALDQIMGPSRSFPVVEKLTSRLENNSAS